MSQWVAASLSVISHFDTRCQGKTKRPNLQILQPLQQKERLPLERNQVLKIGKFPTVSHWGHQGFMPKHHYPAHAPLDIFLMLLNPIYKLG